MPDREYPTGAFAALRALDTHSAPYMLDALAAMSPEDRAALARWAWPEAGNEFAMVELVRAATVKRITEFLHGELRDALSRGDSDHGAIRRLIEQYGRRFPDAVK